MRDAREHGVEVRPVDVNFSDWDATLESGVKTGQPAVRLGLRQVDGLRRDEADKIVATRVNSNELRNDDQGLTFSTIEDLVRATQALPVMEGLHEGPVSRSAIERLAAADAFRSMGRDRRDALWDARGLGPLQELPLFGWVDASALGPEDVVALPQMALAEHVVNDYQTLRLSLKAHPVSFLRSRLTERRVSSCQDIRTLKSGRWVTVAGAVLVRQRPGSAKGVVFMTIEDETGIANIVVWPKTLERYRKVIMTARLIEVRGVIQRHEDSIHIISRDLTDRNDWLAELSDMDEAMSVAMAHADEVLRPDPGSARSPNHPRWAGHPRNERILPKSRDFH